MGEGPFDLWENNAVNLAVLSDGSQVARLTNHHRRCYHPMLLDSSMEWSSSHQVPLNATECAAEYVDRWEKLNVHDRAVVADLVRAVKAESGGAEPVGIFKEICAWEPPAAEESCVRKFTLGPEWFREGAVDLTTLSNGMTVGRLPADGFTPMFLCDGCANGTINGQMHPKSQYHSDLFAPVWKELTNKDRATIQPIIQEVCAELGEQPTGVFTEVYNWEPDALICDPSKQRPIEEKEDELSPATGQAKALIEYMANGYKTTRLTVMNQLNIANLTAVISDVRDLIGRDRVVTLRKTDSRGSPYAEYAIPEPALTDLQERGYLFVNPLTSKLAVTSKVG